MKHPGFTLAELLIALALLGIIAAFTIPKVLQAHAEQERVAKLRETVATLEQAWYNKKAINQLDTLGSFGSNTFSSMNCVEVMLGWPPECILPNGVEIRAFDTTNPTYFGNELTTPQQISNTIILIDINGVGNPPDQAGVDFFYGTFNPWGDFDVGGGVYTFSANGKNFLWGNSTELVYLSDGTALPPPLDVPEVRVGTWLTR